MRREAWLQGSLLFLDVDGVLNSIAYAQRVPGQSVLGIDPYAVIELQRIVDETDCSIVLSSTWRLLHSLDEMRQFLLDAGMRAPVPLRGRTPDLSCHIRQPHICIGVKRGEEVKHWIDAMGFEGRYCCLDDDADFLPGQPLVRTSFNEGLTPALADRCIQILRGLNA